MWLCCISAPVADYRTIRYNKNVEREVVLYLDSHFGIPDNINNYN
jgi:hypothetical protein